MHGVLKLRQQIVHGPDEGWRERYEAIGTEEIVMLPPKSGGESA